MKDSRWTHLLCVLCWNAARPDKPVTGVEDSDTKPDPCCKCGTSTTSGIYVRDNPTQYLCQA